MLYILVRREMSSRYYRLFELGFYLLLVFVVEFRHAIVAVFPKLLLFLALVFLLTFVVGRTAHLLKIIVICCFAPRIATCAGDKAWLWSKRRAGTCYCFEDPTLSPLFQRPPPIS